MFPWTAQMNLDNSSVQCGKRKIVDARVKGIIEAMAILGMMVVPSVLMLHYLQNY